MGGQPPLSGATAIDYRGSRFALGRTADAYGIWDLPAGGGPVLTFPLTHEAWAEAWRTYRYWEETAGAPPPGAPPPVLPGPVAAPGGRGGTQVAGPLTFAQIIEIAARLYGRYAARLILLVAAVVIPVGLIQAVVLRSLPGPLGRAASGGFVRVEEVEEIFPEIIPVILLAALVGFMVNGFLTASVTGAAVDATAGHDVSVSRSAGRALRKLHSVLWILLLEVLVILAGAIVPIAIAIAGAAADLAPLVVLGAVLGAVVLIFLAIRLLFSVPILIAEDRRGWAALRRSWGLVGGRWWRTFGILLLIGLLAGLVGLLFQAIATAGTRFEVSVPLAPGAEPIGGAASYIEALATGIASSLTVPFVALVIVLLYLDARFRTEGAVGGPAGTPRV